MSIWIIGTGQMGIDYAKVLTSLDKKFEVMCRTENSAKVFQEKSGKSAHFGKIEDIAKTIPIPEFAIVAVTIDSLASVATILINLGVKNILLEKPGALTRTDLLKLKELADSKKCNVVIGYNRRFYSSTIEALKQIDKDGGVVSANFEFTEWPDTITPLNFSKKIEEAWILSNSSHVIDLFMYFCGAPKDWSAYRSGSLSWHQTASRFSGAGLTEKGILFSYNADWESPGRWSVEVLTNKNRYIFKPMEQLHVVEINTVAVKKVEIDNSLDSTYKPGLYLQTKAFLEKDYKNIFCTLDEQIKNFEIYLKIAGYSHCD